MRHIPGLGDHRGRPFHHAGWTSHGTIKALLDSAWQLHSDAQPSSASSERFRTDAQSSQFIAAPLFCSAHSPTASERAANCGHTAYGHGYRGGRLGSLQRPFETISVCPGNLLLALDAPSAEATGTVVWGYTVAFGAIRLRKGSRNMCNVKTVLSCWTSPVGRGGILCKEKSGRG